MSTEKITRTVRLTPEVDSRLQALAKHLGTNVNAYLISEIGKCVSRDELAFIAARNSTDMMNALGGLISAMQVEQAEEQLDMLEEKEG